MTLDERIIKVPDPRLRQRWPEILFGESLQTLQAMLDLCRDPANYGRGGLGGLSSVQVEMPGRVITWATTGLDFGACINPLVLERSYDGRWGNEGCYSLGLNKWVRVWRPVFINLRGIDEDGKPRVWNLRGESARYALHELDHLDGILITDYEQESPYEERRNSA